MRVRTRPSRTASGCFARTPPSSSMLQCVAVCCSVCYNVCVTMCCSICCSGLRAHHPPLASFSMLQCVAVCCSVLQCVAVYCSVLHCASQSVAACVAVVRTHTALLQHAAVCCSVCYNVSVTTCCSMCCSGSRAHHPPLACCSVLQCVAVYCSVLHCASQSVAACFAVVRTHTALLQHPAVSCSG